MKNLICGFMGAGKTTFLRSLELKDKIGAYKFIDLDQYILESSGHKSVFDFINHSSWERFREVEQESIVKLIEKNSKLWLALGGGSLNESLLQELSSKIDVKIYWLNTPLDICLSRIVNDASRPMTSLGQDELIKLYKERYQLYSQFESIDFNVLSDITFE